MCVWGISFCLCLEESPLREKDGASRIQREKKSHWRMRIWLPDDEGQRESGEKERHETELLNERSERRRREEHIRSCIKERNQTTS